VVVKEDAMDGAEEVVVVVVLGEDVEEAVTEDGEADVAAVVIGEDMVKKVAAVVTGEPMVKEMELTRRTEEKSSMFQKKF